MEKDNSREALLQAAERLFVEKGYTGVSTRELTDAANVNLGAIQYYFGSKEKLFIETIHHMMQGSPCAHAGRFLQGQIKTKKDAGQALIRFISSFMHYLLKPEGPQACRLLFREILSSTSHEHEVFETLVSSAVEHYTRPLHEALHDVLALIDRKASEKELRYHAHSILGQCVFYVTHKPFLERMHQVQFSDSPHFEETIEHISCFSLRALGCNDIFIQEIMREKTSLFQKAA